MKSTVKKTRREKIISFVCNIILILSWIGRIIYFPVYCAAWLLHKIARLLLAISYFGLLDWLKGADIIKYLFVNYEKTSRN